MKKKLLFIVVTLFWVLLCSCKNARLSEASYKNIEFEIADYYEEFDRTLHYDEDIDWIPDKETAVAVASGIFAGMKKSSDEEKYVPQWVTYDEINGIWVVTFFEELDPNADEAWVGGDINIALSEKTGEVLSVFLGE